MAIGDKSMVVMEDEKAVAGGVATLDSTGILEEAQRPTPAQIGAIPAPSVGGTENQALLFGSSGAPVWETLTPNLVGAADSALSNLTNSQAALAALGAGVRPNLLDNSYFVGGGTGSNVFPVNQKGFTSAGAAYTDTFDRWKIYAYTSGTVGLTEAGANLNGQFDFGTALESSRIPDTPNLPITLSAFTSSGDLITTTGILQNNGQSETISTSLGSETANLLSFTRNWQTNLDLFFFQLSSASNITVVAAKLEIGSGQTLAYQDSGGSWHLLPQPQSDYAAQLAKCHRYYWASEKVFTSNVLYGKNLILCNIMFPQQMVKAPTVMLYSAKGTKNRVSVWASEADVPNNALPYVVTKEAINAIQVADNPLVEGTIYSFKIVASSEL